MQGAIDQLAVQDGGDFVDAVAEQKATVENGKMRLVFRQKGAVQINGADRRGRHVNSVKCGMAE